MKYIQHNILYGTFAESHCSYAVLKSVILARLLISAFNIWTMVDGGGKNVKLITYNGLKIDQKFCFSK